MATHFKGFRRTVGRAGIRNHVLLLPVDRLSNQIAWTIEQQVAGVTRFANPGDYGRTKNDRERLYRIMLGLARNPNTFAVILISMRGDYAYAETRATRLRDALADLGRPVGWVMAEDAGGIGAAVDLGARLARQWVRDASGQEREDIDIGDLTLGVKCGLSDGTSGISGNPSLGRAVDLLIGDGGSAIFSETTEVIGAEQVLGDRTTPAIAEQLYTMVRRTEALAAATGEDIRTINPIPSNIKAGISTLEEKSLGAIAKGGTTPLQGVLEHAVPHQGRGLFFMDGWMASNSLPVALAAAGAQAIVFQMGGNDVQGDLPAPATNPALVAPLFLMSGNPNLARSRLIGLDFDASPVLTGEAGLGQTGELLYGALRRVAGGLKTWGETLKWQENIEVWFDGPFL
jgi:altronate dehydratase large subunit